MTIVGARGIGKTALARGRELQMRIDEDRSLRSGIEDIVLVNLCMSLTQLGELNEALDVARRAYPLVEQAGRVLDLLDPFALLAFKRGHPDDAARLGRADRRYAADNHQREAVEEKLRDELMSNLRQALPAGELSRLMREGEALSDEACARLALEDRP